ncbi:hypothetical protein [Sandaracinus amylolyticus]|uniref:Uncharacterized protein n=1 Tax=Sandaracinus amylolyticus TaxID=927083 RepID=A0A0F6W5M8_9BACT|nr:hypothetical protein [Sandaracinus amylolyticus]AKF08036.1 hypothetical protein DB32_005185 [Sandaracinus amylolyticus]
MKRVMMAMIVLTACSERAPQPVTTERRDEPTEPIATRRGGREVRVRCALECEGARDELGRQHRACIDDPTSTPHHVSDRAAMIALGCCSEVEGIYAEACGVESIEACVSRWSAECASGRLQSPEKLQPRGGAAE